VIPLGHAEHDAGEGEAGAGRLRMKWRSIASVISKSAITPWRSGRVARIEAGVLAESCAWPRPRPRCTLPVSSEIATTDGSKSTIPRPRMNTQRVRGAEIDRHVAGPPPNDPQSRISGCSLDINAGMEAEGTDSVPRLRHLVGASGRAGGRRCDRIALSARRPGANWLHMKPYEALAGERRVVFYDQLGAGNSAIEGAHDPSMWTPELFVEEVGVVREALGLERVPRARPFLGGMLGMQYAATQPDGLVSLIVESSPPSVPAWMG